MKFKATFLRIFEWIIQNISLIPHNIKIPMNSKFLLTTLLLCIVGLLSAQTVYVQPFGTGNGTSWSNATDLQSALQSATSGTTIWVKEGVHNPVTCNPCTQVQREFFFEIPTGVQVYGGFDGTETSLNQRNSTANVTVLSGDIDGDGTATNNSNTVVYFHNVSNQTILDGFSIRDGRADFNDAGDVSERRRGGGIYNDGSLSGGSSSPTIRNCIIENNYAISQGGGMYNNAIFSGSTSPLIEDCIFRDNVSDLGGALYNNGREGNCLPTFNRCQFFENQAFATGGAVYSFARLGNGFANPKFTNCLFRANFASSSGAVYSLGVSSGNVITEITNCTFVGNYANTGGAVYVNASDGGICSADVSNSIFWQNFASFDNIFHYSGDSGPVINLSNSLVDIANCDDLLLGVGSINCQSGIIYSQDPLFTNLEGFDYHLVEASPCINTGSNANINTTGETTDLDGSQRIQGGTVDMGCFEFGGQANIPLTITQQTQNQTGCEGLSATFSMSATGTQPLTYQWRKNNVNMTGETLNSLTINDLSDTDLGSYSCVVTDVNGENLTSQSASLTVLPIVVPAVSLAADDLEVCMGENVVFTATPTNGGTSGSPFYIWQVNGSNVEGENTAVFTLEDAEGDEVVQVTMISSETCAVPSSAFSDLLMVTTTSDTEPAIISISTDADEICLGETVVFNSSVANAGDNPTYIWRLNGTVVSMTENYTTNELTAGNSVVCEVTTIGSCGEILTTNSDALSVNITTPAAPQISIESSETQICQGETVVFTSSVTNPGESQSYVWRLNGEIVSMTDTYTTDLLEPTNGVICEVTVTDECGVENTTVSNAQTVSVQVPIVPQVTIQTSNTTVCAGADINFSAIVQNAGDSPTYDWRVNDISVAVGNQYTSNALNDSDVVTCLMTTSQTCVTASEVSSNAISVTIIPIANPEISLTASGTEVCEGGSVTFNATTIDGGTNPTVIWFVNGTMFTDEGLELTINNITAFTSVQVQMETSAPCPANLLAFSETIGVAVLTGITPTVMITGEETEFCNSDDLSGLFTAAANFPPVSYLWSVNGEEVQNSSENSLSLTNFGTGDVITCQTISEGGCLTTTEADSDEIILTVFELPVVSLATFDTICSTGDLFLLDGGAPFGGEYLGDFIGTGLFDPMAADVGFHTVTYTYTDENNCANFAEEQIEVVLCTDVNEVQLVDLEVYPNPFTSRIQIFSEDILSVEMRNVEGRVISISSEVFADNAIVTGDHLVAGVYFLRVLTENGVGVSVLVKE